MSVFDIKGSRVIVFFLVVAFCLAFAESSVADRPFNEGYAEMGITDRDEKQESEKSRQQETSFAQSVDKDGLDSYAMGAKFSMGGEGFVELTTLCYKQRPREEDKGDSSPYTLRDSLLLKIFKGDILVNKDTGKSTVADQDEVISIAEGVGGIEAYYVKELKIGNFPVVVPDGSTPEWSLKPSPAADLLFAYVGGNLRFIGNFLAADATSWSEILGSPEPDGSIPKSTSIEPRQGVRNDAKAVADGELIMVGVTVEYAIGKNVAAVLTFRGGNTQGEIVDGVSVTSETASLEDLTDNLNLILKF